MSGPGAVQLFMFLIRCWTSATVMVTGCCSRGFLWFALKSCNYCASVLCVFSSSHIVFQDRSVFAFGGSGLTVVLHWSWEYTLDGSLENRAFIVFVSASLVYLSTCQCCEPLLSSPLYFPSSLVLSFNSTPFCISPSWLTSLLVVCFQDYSGCSIHQFIGFGDGRSWDC